MKEVINENLWNFGMNSQESMNVVIWIYIGFHQRDRQNSQSLKNENDTFCRLPVTSCRAIIGPGKHPDAGISLNYDDGDCSKGSAQFKECFKALTKGDILQPYLSDDNFRSSNTRVDITGYEI